MQKLSGFILTALLICGAPLKDLAQTVQKDSLDYYDMSLDQLLKLKAHGVPTELEALINSLISVASKKPLSTRESPSIVSLITEEEIKKSGARDLIDVLRLVPGLDFGVDVEGVVGLGMRGSWAHEGKILLLLDGQEMNEMLFATTQFGNHYPIEQIKKIEVIRGPGSAIYGGFAEYGVINIITNQGEDMKGLVVSGTYGQTDKDYARRNFNLSIGNKKKDLEYSLSTLLGQGQRSDQRYVDFSGNSAGMSGASSLNPGYINAAIKYKNTSLRFIGDYYRTSMRDAYGTVVSSGPVKESFNSEFVELKYTWKQSDKFTITPRFNYKRQSPWKSAAYEGKEAYDKTAARILGNITASFNMNRYVNIVAGVEGNTDAAIDNGDSSYFSNGEAVVNYNNYALFAQGLIKNRIVNFILGARYDRHSAYGDAFVPRVGLTKRYGRFHFKALYSGAFRAPAIENINYSTDAGIKPELTQVAEVECGYQITRKSILTVNVYDVTTKNPIVYFTDSTNADFYINSGKSGTQGIEAEYRIKSKWGHVAVNYAFYTAHNKAKIADYEVQGESSLLGFANHRLNLNASFNLTDNLSLSYTASFYGSRWGYGSVDSLGNSELKEFWPVMLLNVFVHYTTPVNGLTAGIGIYDILDQKFTFLQPYNGYHAPLPGPSREFMIRLQYTLNLKKKTSDKGKGY